MLSRSVLCQSGSHGISDDLFVLTTVPANVTAGIGLPAALSVVKREPQRLCLVWIDERSGVVTKLGYAIQLFLTLSES